MAFKQKSGSPFQRNFGIGSSPIKNYNGPEGSQSRADHKPNHPHEGVGEKFGGHEGRPGTWVSEDKFVADQPLPMKSPLEHRVTSYDSGDNRAKRHNMDYESNPKHDEDMHGKKRREEIEKGTENKQGKTRKESPDFWTSKTLDPVLPMKSPIKQITVEGVPRTVKQSLGFLEGDSDKKEKRKKYMTNKEYYEENPELKPDPKDNMFRDVDEDGNVITRGLRGIGKGFGNLGRAIGNIKLKGGGRGGYDMGPGGRGGWRG